MKTYQPRPAQDGQSLPDLASRLLHPLWWTALILMVTNDHLFKGGGLIPIEIAGKLSDFSGMIVAPVLVAILLQVRTRRGLLGVHLLVAATFAAINLSGALAAGFDAMTAVTGFAWRTTVDPTDLMALPMLWASWWLLTTRTIPPVRKGSIHHWAQRSALVAGSLLCMANTPPPDPNPMPPGPPIFPSVSAALMIGNDTPVTLNFRVRPLRDTIIVDCATVAEDPQAMLSREAFGPAVVWQVEPGRSFAPREFSGLEPDCDAFLIDGADVPAMLLFWNSSAFPITEMATTVADGDPNRVITISGDPAREVLRWSTHGTVNSAPSTVDPQAEVCGIPSPGVGVTWETPAPVGDTRIHSLASAPDGCIRLSIGPGEAPERNWYLCGVPGLQLPFVAGDKIAITENKTGQNIHPIAGVTIYNERYTVRFGSGSDMVNVGPATWYVDFDPECSGSQNECGEYVQPLELSLLMDGQHTQRLRAGEHANLASGGTFHLLRAESLPVANTACHGDDDAVDTGLSLHTMFVELHEPAASKPETTR